MKNLITSVLFQNIYPNICLCPILTMEKLITLFTLEFNVPFLISQLLDFMMHRERKEQLLKYMQVDDYERYLYEDLIEERWELLSDIKLANLHKIAKVKLLYGFLLFNKDEIRRMEADVAKEFGYCDYSELDASEWLQDIQQPIKSTKYMLFVNNSYEEMITDVLSYSSEEERDKVYKDLKFVFRRGEFPVDKGSMIRRDNYDYITLEGKDYCRRNRMSNRFRVHHTHFQTKKIRKDSVIWLEEWFFDMKCRMNVVYSYNPKKKKIIWIDILETRIQRNIRIRSKYKKESRKGRVLCIGYSYHMAEGSDIFVMILNGEKLYFEFY